MKIKKIKTEVFAGINDKEYNFDDGLNILLGNNEAGKSTLINAIYAALFIEPQIKLNTAEGKMFKRNYFPYPDGDYAEAEVEIKKDNKKYRFYKKWSNNNYQGFLELEDGRRIENSKKISKYQEQIFNYNKSTYKNIIFSSQKDIKNILEKINAAENPELIDNINSFLRKAVMELDGISIDKFKEKLEDELDNLLKKWNLETDSVKNSERGINNPYKIATGKIYDVYIAKEKLRRKIKNGKITEEKYRKNAKQIKKLKKEESKLIKEIEALSEKEAEINQRAAVEVEKDNLEEKIITLENKKQRWPLIQNNLKKLRAQKADLKKKLNILKAEKLRAEKLDKKNTIMIKVKKIKKFKSEIKKLQNDINKQISEKNIEKLEEYKNNITEAEASLKAARLQAKINYLDSEKLKFKSGINEENYASEGQTIEAEGYLRIKTENLDIEIESSGINFEKLEKSYQINKNNFLKLKDKMKIESLKEGRKKLRKINEKENIIKHKREEIIEILDGRKLEFLEKQLKDLKLVNKARDISIIESEIEELKEKKSEIKTEIKILENKKEELTAEFESIKKIKELLTKKNKRVEVLEQKLDSLASLPQNYNNTQEFIESLKDKRKKREEINIKLRKKLERNKELENNLPETGSREMQSELKNYEERFKNLKNKAHNLIQIKEVFEKKLEKMDEDSFKPLVKNFNKNLRDLTAGKYENTIINEDFSIKLESKTKKRLPGNIEILSYGTYDAAALALRFAIFDMLFEKSGGFIVLDDCLVNLDPERQKNAIKLIRKYQKKYQIIYSTCDPQLAKNFDANIIEV